MDEFLVPFSFASCTGWYTAARTTIPLRVDGVVRKLLLCRCVFFRRTGFVQL